MTSSLGKNLMLGLCLAVVSAGFWSCSTDSAGPDPAGENTGGTVKAKMSAGLEGATVFLTQGETLDSFTAAAGDSVFEFNGLEAGNYELKVVMPDGNTFISPVNVTEGQIRYLGEITRVGYGSGTSGDSAKSDFVQWHSPGDLAEVIFQRPDAYHPEPRYRLSVSFQFSRPMDRQSIEDALVLEPPAEGYFTWNDYFQPVYAYDYGLRLASADMAAGEAYVPSAEITTYSNITSCTFHFALKNSYPDTTYTVKLTTAARDSSGTAVADTFAFSFSTIQSSVSFDRMITSPQDGEDYAALIQGNGITVTFPRRMNQASVESNLIVTPAGNYTYLWQDYNVLSIYTGGVLLPQTEYTLICPAAVLDLEGNATGRADTCSFTTAPLYLKSSAPRNGQIGVSKTDSVVLTFNSYMDLDSVRSRITFVDAPGAAVPVSIYTRYYYYSYSGAAYYLDQVVVKPSAPLAGRAKYTLTVAAGARDLLGGATTQAYKVEFITMP
jgi:hypothetical protein